MNSIMKIPELLIWGKFRGKCDFIILVNKRGCAGVDTYLLKLGFYAEKQEVMLGGERVEGVLIDHFLSCPGCDIYGYHG
ncbi:hypothetical protein EOPP23_07265 [Endozoicomonas sp. OPT23]|nr:hypothetical protein [Endozoicomonas sp. OPT23]